MRTLYSLAIRTAICSAVFSSLASANTECQTLGNAFMLHLGQDKQISATQEVASGGQTAGCVVSYSGGGYAVVSLASSFHPVKSYSLSGNFDALPPSVKSFYINELNKEAGISDTTIHKTREYLQHLKARKRTLLYAPSGVSLPLESKWNQSTLYQRYTPRLNGVETYAGCVNIALGQIMLHHKHPAQGSGFVTTQWQGSTLKAITNRPYNWDNMPLSLTTNTPEYQIEEVSRLVRDLGIANNTNFGTTGSGAYLNISTLYKNFGYSKNILHLGLGTSTRLDFFNTIKSEVNSNRPVYMSLPDETHAVVADDYSLDSNGVVEYIHLNYGWGGASNENRNVNAFTSAQINYNIKPCSSAAGDCYTNNDLENSDTQATNVLIGKFASSDDEDSYSTYFSGLTTFNFNGGDSVVINNVRYYYNYYINIYDVNGALVWAFDAGNMPQSKTLATGKYKVVVSLSNHETGYYYDINALDTYNSAVTTTALSSAQIAQIDTSLLTAPTISNEFTPIALQTNTEHKILIDAANENDITSISTTIGNTSVATTQLNGNVLTINPLTAGATNLKIKAFANGKESEKTQTIVVTNIKAEKTKELNGTFTSSTSEHLFDVALDGTCTISGKIPTSDVTYINSFFITVDGTTNNEPIQKSFARGTYGIKASLTSGSSHFTYSLAKANFVITASCPNANETLIASETAANVLDSNSTKTIASGWNLVALPSNDKISKTKLLTTYPQIKIVWQYQNGAWLAATSDATVSTALKSNNINELKYIDSEDGFWIQADSTFSLLSDGASKTNIYNKLVSSANGWSLVGIQSGTTPQDVFGQVSGANLIWAYKTNTGWEVASRATLPTGLPYGVISNIDAGSGVWVKK